MRFDEMLALMYTDYKEFTAEIDKLREEGLSEAEIREAVADFPHPAYPTDEVEAVWRELAALAVTAFVSSGTEDLLESYLEV